MSQTGNESGGPLAAQLRQLVSGVRSELRAALDPHRLGMSQLGVNRYQGTLQPYDDQAFATWTAQVERAPDDLDAVHHLAIMHHARAMDLEQGTDPRDSNPDWDAALRLWHRLWTADAFWQDLGEVIKNPGQADSLRQEFPRLLLAVHYDIAFDPGTKSHTRARDQIAMALESAFPNEDKDAVRDAAYARVVSNSIIDVWSRSADPALVDEALERIRAFLRKDPGCTPALSDALRLQVRQLGHALNEYAAARHDPVGQQRVVAGLDAEARSWSSFFDQLVARADWLEDDVREDAARWYRFMGQAERARNDHRRAVACYDQAVAVAPATGEEREACLCEAGAEHAYVAYEAAATAWQTGQRQAAALRGLQRVQAREGLAARKSIASLLSTARPGARGPGGRRVPVVGAGVPQAGRGGRRRRGSRPERRTRGGSVADHGPGAAGRAASGHAQDARGHPQGAA